MTTIVNFLARWGWLATIVAVAIVSIGIAFMDQAFWQTLGIVVTFFGVTVVLLSVALFVVTSTHFSVERHGIIIAAFVIGVFLFVAVLANGIYGTQYHDVQIGDKGADTLGTYLRR